MNVHVCEKSTRIKLTCACISGTCTISPLHTSWLLQTGSLSLWELEESHDASLGGFQSSEKSLTTSTNTDQTYNFTTKVTELTHNKFEKHSKPGHSSGEPLTFIRTWMNFFSIPLWQPFKSPNTIFYIVQQISRLKLSISIRFIQDLFLQTHQLHKHVKSLHKNHTHEPKKQHRQKYASAESVG